jgi:gp16 family phage-associated protein
MSALTVKESLRQQGLSIKDWVASKGLPESDYQTARSLLNGFSKGVRGKAHRVAVALGLKPNPEADITKMRT